MIEHHIRTLQEHAFNERPTRANPYGRKFHAECRCGWRSLDHVVPLIDGRALIGGRKHVYEIGMAHVLFWESQEHRAFVGAYRDG